MIGPFRCSMNVSIANFVVLNIMPDKTRGFACLSRSFRNALQHALLSEMNVSCTCSLGLEPLRGQGSSFRNSYRLRPFLLCAMSYWNSALSQFLTRANLKPSDPSVLAVRRVVRDFARCPACRSTTCVRPPWADLAVNPDGVGRTSGGLPALGSMPGDGESVAFADWAAGVRAAVSRASR